MKEKTKKKEVHFFIPEYLYDLVKKEANQKGVTLTRLFTSAMMEYLMKESNDKNMPTM